MKIIGTTVKINQNKRILITKMLKQIIKTKKNIKHKILKMKLLIWNVKKFKKYLKIWNNQRKLIKLKDIRLHENNERQKYKIK